MEITSELIQRFFQHNCDAEEAEAVVRHLELHPEDAKQWLGVEEWNAWKGQPVPEGEAAAALVELRARLFVGAERTVDGQGSGRPTDGQGLSREGTGQASDRQPGARGAIVRRFSWTAVAASLLLLAGGLVWLAKRDSRGVVAGTNGGKQGVADGGYPAPGEGEHAARRIDQANTSGEAQRLVLPDGSNVTLYAHSSLHYTDSFGLLRRDVRLVGTADFAVKKDGAHPFCVLTGKLATTVLGTSFRVRAPAGAGDVVVKLYTGKVVVRSLHFLAGWKDILLAPGEEMVYDDRRMLAVVNKAEVRQGNAEDGGAASGGGDLVFNNSPLKNVLRQLSIQYHKKIIYRARDIAGRNFTGSLLHTDSLDTFLQLLGTMNNLDIQDQPAGIKVTRHKE